MSCFTFGEWNVSQINKSKFRFSDTNSSKLIVYHLDGFNVMVDVGQPREKCCYDRYWTFKPLGGSNVVVISIIKSQLYVFTNPDRWPPKYTQFIFEPRWIFCILCIEIPSVCSRGLTLMDGWPGNRMRWGVKLITHNDGLAALIIRVIHRLSLMSLKLQTPILYWHFLAF